MPGASAHQVFAGMVLRAALKTLQRAATAMVPVKSKGAAKKTKTKATAATNAQEKESDDEREETAAAGFAAMDEEEDEDEAEAMVTLTPAAINAARECLVDLVLLLRTFNLKENAELLDLSAQVSQGREREREKREDRHG